MTEKTAGRTLPLLEGERVLLRPIAPEDTPLIVKWRNTEAVRQNFIYRGPFTEEIHRRWLETKVASGEVVQYVILDRQSGEPVGSVYFRDISPANQSAEYGIFIGESAGLGKGFGSETARLFTAFGFETLGLHRIGLRLLSDNVRARKSYENAGFQVEGVFRDMVRLDGRYRDVIFMAKLAGEDRA